MSESAKKSRPAKPAEPPHPDAANLFFFARQQARQRLTRVEANVHALLAMPAGSEPTIEGIHALRVSLRRFRAVLDTFPRFFPARDRRLIRTAIRTIFQSAGEVRNRDITAEMLRDLNVDGTGLLADKLHVERLAFEQPLRDLLLGWVRDDFASRWREGLRLP